MATVATHSHSLAHPSGVSYVWGKPLNHKCRGWQWPRQSREWRWLTQCRLPIRITNIRYKKRVLQGNRHKRQIRLCKVKASLRKPAFERRAALRVADGLPSLWYKASSQTLPISTYSSRSLPSRSHISKSTTSRCPKPPSAWYSCEWYSWHVFSAEI